MNVFDQADRLILLLQEVDERLRAEGHVLAASASEACRLAATLAGVLDGVEATHLENRWLRLATLAPLADDVPSAPDPELVLRRVAYLAVVDEVRVLLAGADARCADVAAIAGVVARYDRAMAGVDARAAGLGRAG